MADVQPVVRVATSWIGRLTALTARAEVKSGGYDFPVVLADKENSNVCHAARVPSVLQYRRREIAALGARRTQVTKVRPQKTSADSTDAVDQFMKALEHPFKKEIAALRSAILAVDPSITEGVKWNAPSFRTKEYFATTNLRAKDGVGLILHLGAKVRDLPKGGVKISDPDGLLKWLGKDRAAVEFPASELKSKTRALQAVLRQWIEYV
jgi:hypothetical protein